LGRVITAGELDFSAPFDDLKHSHTYCCIWRYTSTAVLHWKWLVSIAVAHRGED
jgi:hypothetical protein